jgi:hypothetical protein
MNMFKVTVTVFAAIGSTAVGEDVWPNIFGMPMEHIMVSMDGSDLHAHVGTDASNRIEMRMFAGEVYSGASGVLTDTYYSDQYGWALDGIVDPGAGNSIWIEQTFASDGLSVFQGGMRMMRPMHSYDPIFGTLGSDSAWQWSGGMTHNWYSVVEAGLYEASYRVYIGDSQGDAVHGFGEASVSLYFEAVPAPGVLGLFAGAGVFSARRKRGTP